MKNLKRKKHPPWEGWPRPCCCMCGCCLVMLLVCSMGITGQSLLLAQAPEASSALSSEAIDGLLKAGEFVRAKQAIEQLPAAQQDAARSQLAIAQGSLGLPAAAVKTLSGIGQGPLRQDTIRELTAPKRAWLASSSNPSNANPSGPDVGDSYVGDRAPARGPNAGPVQPGGAGGAAIADFDSLIELIQTTIVPDTWDLLGGPSTISPYRAGIHVDLNGLVRDIEIGQSDRLNRLRRSAMPKGHINRDWTQPSEMRIVSLKRLMQAWLVERIAGTAPSPALENMAGLSEIQHVLVIEDDLWLAGRVGGIDPQALPWPRDQQTGRVTLGLDLVVASARAVLNGVSYGCSIDPSRAGLAAGQQVTQEIVAGKIPTAMAADQLAKALGPQDISLIGVQRDSPLAWLLVDADRHMKQLALGKYPMPEGVANYLDVLDEHIKRTPEQGVPAGELLRLWFASRGKVVRKAADSSIYELSGMPMQLMSAREFADAVGQRTQAGNDPLGSTFAEHFNQNLTAILERYPVYDRLRGAFEITAALQLIRREFGQSAYQQLVADWTSADALAYWQVPVPVQCESIAVRQVMTVGKKRHQIFIASGGISIDPDTILVSQSDVYPQLDQLRRQMEKAPIATDLWWWDQQ